MEDKRVVSKERGEAIAREHNISFLETSAKVCWDQFERWMIKFSFQTNINIETAFIELAESILDKSNVQEAKPAPFPQPQPASGPRCPGCSQ